MLKGTLVVKLRMLRKLMGTSPEEVANWRAERRAHWPSKQVVDAKRGTAVARDASGRLAPAAQPAPGQPGLDESEVPVRTAAKAIADTDLDDELDAYFRISTAKRKKKCLDLSELGETMRSENIGSEVPVEPAAPKEKQDADLDDELDAYFGSSTIKRVRICLGSNKPGEIARIEEVTKKIKVL